MTARGVAIGIVAVLCVGPVGGRHAWQCASAESPAPAPVVFESVVRGAPPASTPDRPAVYVARTPADLQTFLGYLPAEQRDLVHAAAARQIVVAVFAGAAPTSGHEITVKRILVSPDVLTIVVDLRTPAPTDYVRPAFTVPYEVVRLVREGVSAALPRRWSLVDVQGRILAQGVSRAGN